MSDYLIKELKAEMDQFIQEESILKDMQDNKCVDMARALGEYMAAVNSYATFLSLSLLPLDEKIRASTFKAILKEALKTTARSFDKKERWTL